MQKDRLQSVKVRPRTAIERAPSLGAAARIAFKTADDRTVRLWPCTTQTMQLRLQGVQIMYSPRYHSHSSSLWLAACSSWYGRARVLACSPRARVARTCRSRPMLAGSEDS